MKRSSLLLLSLTISFFTFGTIDKAHANSAAITAGTIVEMEVAAETGGLWKLARFAGRLAGVVGIAELAAEVWYDHVLEKDYGVFALDDVLADTVGAFDALIHSDDPVEKEMAAQHIENTYAMAKGESDPDSRGDGDDTPTAPDGTYGGDDDRGRDRGYGGPDDTSYGGFGGGGDRNGGDGVLF